MVGDARDMLRVAEAAKVAGVGTRELLAMIDRGEVEAERVDGQLVVRREAAETARGG